MEPQKQFTIRKKIAKHGINSIIVIPKLLQNELSPKTIVDVNIRILENPEQESEDETKNFAIRKKIAKHGINSIIIIPKLLQNELSPKTIVEVSIEVLGEAEEEGR